LLRGLFLRLQDFAAAYLSFSFASPALGQVKLPALFLHSQFSVRLEFSLRVDPSFSPALKFFRPFCPFSLAVERTLRRPSVLAQGFASHGASTPQRRCLHNVVSSVVFGAAALSISQFDSCCVVLCRG
jgi:hypothetical protein